MKHAKKWALFKSKSLLILFLAGQSVLAQDLTIFDSRRPVSLSSNEKPFRDFYINGGIEQGMKRGMILTVTRRLTLYDTYRANSPKELMVEVGRVKVIFAQKGLSVARYYGDFSRKEKAILENDFIMVGDKIDMSSALMESQLKKKSAKREKTKSIGFSKQLASSSVKPSAEKTQDEKVESQPVPMSTLQ